MYEDIVYPQETLITCQEAAERLRLSVQTVRRMAAAGLFKARRVGQRRVLVSLEAVDAYLAGRPMIKEGETND